MNWLFEWFSLVSAALCINEMPGTALGWTPSIVCSTSCPGQSLSTVLSEVLLLLPYPFFLSYAHWTPSCCGQRTETWWSPWCGWGQMCLDLLDHICVSNMWPLLQFQTRREFLKIPTITFYLRITPFCTNYFKGFMYSIEKKLLNCEKMHYLSIYFFACTPLIKSMCGKL